MINVSAIGIRKERRREREREVTCHEQAADKIMNRTKRGGKGRDERQGGGRKKKGKEDPARRPSMPGAISPGGRGKRREEKKNTAIPVFTETFAVG